MLVYKGKVRDVYDEDHHYKIVASNRLSAFNQNVCEVNDKGFYLTRQAAFWFTNTEHIIPNHMIKSCENIMIVKKCIPFKVEVVVRQYITGSLWKDYSKGERLMYGISFPEGLKKNQKLEDIIVTPTEKSDTDDPITEEIVVQKFMVKEEWDYIKKKAIELFEYVSKIMLEKGFILVDTKMEFGKDDEGKILLIDECFTTDCSRFWTFESYKKDSQAPESFDKDLIRERISSGGKVDQSLLNKLTHRYREYYKVLIS